MKDYRTTHAGAKRGRKPGELTIFQVSFPCDTCHAVPGQSCLPLAGKKEWVTPHADRVRKAEAAELAALKR